LALLHIPRLTTPQVDSSPKIVAPPRRAPTSKSVNPADLYRINVLGSSRASDARLKENTQRENSPAKSDTAPVGNAKAPIDLDSPIVSVATLEHEVNEVITTIVDTKRKRFANTKRTKDGTQMSDYPKESQTIYTAARQHYNFYLATHWAYPTDAAANTEAQQCVLDAARQAELDAGGTLGTPLF
jgi:hypothetical protein